MFVLPYNCQIFLVNGPLLRPWPPTAAKVQVLECPCTLVNYTVSQKMTLIYSTVALVPPMSTIDVWRGIT